MYLVIRNHKVIAAHHDLDIVEQYVSSQSSNDMKILQLKKKKAKELREHTEFEDIYLVRYGDNYIPYDQYMVMKDLSSQRDYDLTYCRDVLFRLLEEGTVDSEKDISAIKRVILLLERTLEPQNDLNYDQIESIKSEMLRQREEMNYLKGE